MWRFAILSVCALASGCTKNTDPEPSVQIDSSVALPDGDDSLDGVAEEALELPAALTGLSHPESALYDAEADRWYVSNIVGGPADVDGIGWITTVDGAGTVETEQWISGLNAPKGMAQIDDRLWVSDVHELVEIDIATASVLRRIPVEGAAFLNDVASDGEHVFVSGMGTGRIHRADPVSGEIVVWSEDPRLTDVNGLSFDEGGALVAGTFSDEGHLVRVTEGSVQVIATEVGMIDGVVRHEHGWIVTDYRGRLLRVTDAGDVSVLDELAESAGVQSSADLGIDPERRWLLIPDLEGNQAVWIAID